MRFWSNLKTWKKGAIIGGIWGLVSVIGFGFASYYLNPTIAKIIFFPSWFIRDVLYGSPIPLIYVIYIAWPIGLLVILLVGAFIGAGLGFLSEKSRERK